jgi:hypothetical protein
MKKQESRLEALKREGWTRQFIANEPRLSEAVELYKETGYEVHLEPIPPAGKAFDFPQAGKNRECRVCFEGSEDEYKIIFTRPKKDGSGPDDDLSS